MFYTNPRKPIHKFWNMFENLGFGTLDIEIWASKNLGGSKFENVYMSYFGRLENLGIWKFRTLKFGILKSWEFYFLKCWNRGILGNRNFGTLTLWNFEFWKYGTNKWGNDETKKRRNEEMRKRRNEGTKKPRNQETKQPKKTFIFNERIFISW